MADQHTLATQPEDTRHSTVGAESGFVAGEQVAGRYVVDGPLGRGASGEVLSVTDLSLDRHVAMKVLRGAGGPVIARFMREARVTARIDHPNVPPVHLLEFLPDGGVLFTMRRLDGTSLGEAIRRRADGQAVPTLASVNAIVQIIQRICDALARAHALGIVHRDVKPDNIMLGAHGDIALVDWGECRLLSEADTSQAGSTVGTPAYMSPEQARGEAADQRSDVYALGATLFHAFTGRMPTWDADPERFWERKRRGDLDALPADAEAALPRQLLAIARRALAAQPSERYASAEDLAADLDRYQAGLAVAAYRESAPERLARWLYRHRVAVTAAGLVILLAAGAALLLRHERQRSLAGWGEPVLVEDLADDGWRERWIEARPGTLQREGSELVSQAPDYHFLMLRQPLSGTVAIEYEGRFLPQAKPGDLSVVWSEAPTAEEAAADMVDRAQWRGLWVQAGAYDNHFCAIYRRDFSRRLDFAPVRLAPEARHRFRVEFDGSVVRMLIDGSEVTRAQERLPIGTGRIGFYAYYPGKAIGRIRVFQKQVAELQPATAVGDAFTEQGLHRQAAIAYQRAADSLAGSALAEEARLRQGLAWRMASEPARARLAWAGLTGELPRARAALYTLDDELKAGDVAEACTGLRDLLRQHGSLRHEAAAQWQSWADLAIRRCWHLAIATLIATKLEALADHHGSDYELVRLYQAIGRHDEVATRLPDEVQHYTTAMRELGRLEECAARLPGFPQARRLMLLEGGRFAEFPPDETSWESILAATWSGHPPVSANGFARHWISMRTTPPEELLAGEPPPVERMAALLGLGRYEEALSMPRFQYDGGLRDLGTMLTGRLNPLDADGSLDPEQQAWAMVELAARGDHASLERHQAELREQWPLWSRWHAWLIVGPSLLPPGERAAVLRQRLEETARLREVTGQRAWHIARYALGRCDEAELARMPTVLEIPLWTCVARALRCELAGDEAGVRLAWTDYRALPSHRRLSLHAVPHPALERLARFKTEGQ